MGRVGAAADTGSSVAGRAAQPVPARYLLVWLTSLPPAGTPVPPLAGASLGSRMGWGAQPTVDQPAYRGGVAEVRVSGTQTASR